MRAVNSFNIPNIIPGKYNSVEITLHRKPPYYRYGMYVDNTLWMTYINHNNQAYQLYSHNYFAYGNVCTTGLGFGIREQMLLDNPKVKSVTVIEICQDLIDYHKRFNPDLMSRLNVICADANNIKYDCDVLLLDHYEDELPQLDQIYENISHELMWFWEAEIVPNYDEFKQRYPTLPDYDKILFEKLREIYKYKDPV